MHSNVAYTNKTFTPFDKNKHASAARKVKTYYDSKRKEIDVKQDRKRNQSSKC